jgi:methionyl-tRNA formyltransferase
VAQALRIGVISSGPDEFRTIHAACEEAGHTPVAYFYARSPRPRTANLPDAEQTTAAILSALPPGMDFLLPGSTQGLALLLSGYRPDLLIVFGFGWKLPKPVLQIPRLGALNIHVSMLPKYRGPAPLLWAIRNGDPVGGVTVHRMDEGFDTGNIIAQQDGIPLVDDITWARYCAEAMPVIHRLLKKSLGLVADGYRGTPQDHTASTYAGFMEEEFSTIDWSRNAREIHNQVRTHRYMRSPDHPVAKIGNNWIRVIRTSTPPADGLEVPCADGPLWILESEPVNPREGTSPPP